MIVLHDELRGEAAYRTAAGEPRSPHTQTQARIKIINALLKGAPTTRDQAQTKTARDP